MAAAGACWRALGTTAHLLVTDPADLESARVAVVEVLASVDATYSRFRSDSELSVLQREGPGTRQVSPLLARALDAALRGARWSGGAVDPTVGRAMRIIGYDDDFATVAARGGPLRLAACPIPGWEVVELDVARLRLTLAAGVELDLGSTGKALAADLAAQAAATSAAGAGVLVSLGGDIAAAGPPPPGGWQILVSEDSETPSSAGGETVAIRSGGIATSSTMVRRWNGAGTALHHIIDPETGLPAGGRWRTATVAAATCLDANVAATAAIVRGHGILSWLARYGLPARLVDVDGEVSRLNGWPHPRGVAA